MLLLWVVGTPFTLPELITLVRYHYHSTWGGNVWKISGKFSKSDKHSRLLGHFRSMLVRYGFDGYGDPSEDNGIVIFAGERVKLVELVAEAREELQTPQQQQYDWPDCFETLAEVSAFYEEKGTEAAKELGTKIRRRPRPRTGDRK